MAAASAVVESPQMEHVICSKGLLLVKNRFTVYTPNPLGLPYYIIGIYGVIWDYHPPAPFAREQKPPALQKTVSPRT